MALAEKEQLYKELDEMQYRLQANEHPDGRIVADVLFEFLKTFQKLVAEDIAIERGG